MRTNADEEVFNEDDYHEVVHTDNTVFTFFKEWPGNLCWNYKKSGKEEREIETWETAAVLLQKYW